MELAQIILAIVQVVGTFIMNAVQNGSLDAALEQPLSSIIPRDLKTSLAKKAADEAAARKFGTPS